MMDQILDIEVDEQSNISSSELRIGNWVEYECRHYQVHEFDKKLILITFKDGETGTYSPGANHSGVRRALLSEGWLYGFGFSVSETNGVFEFENIFVSIIDGWCSFAIRLDFPEPNVVILKRIKYVHQLQNLFFELKDRELEFNRRKN